MAKVDVFSDEWCKTWVDKVRSSKTFSEYNKGWQGDIGCVMYMDAANLFFRFRFSGKTEKIFNNCFTVSHIFRYCHV